MNNRLNCDETLAKQWLESQGHGVVRPCQDPPDFLADGEFAVEVRRLNRQVKGRGEEEFERPLRGLIEATIKTMRPREGTWIVDAEYQPEGYPDSKKAKREIREALSPLVERCDGGVLDELRSRYSSGCEHSHELDHLSVLHLCLPCGIHLELHRIETSIVQFSLGNISEGEGLLLDPVIQESVEFAIEDKSRKIAGREQEHKWWLILVDHIGVVSASGLSRTELASLRRRVRVVAPWNRVVVVSRQCPEWWYELCPDDEVPCGRL